MPIRRLCYMVLLVLTTGILQINKGRAASVIYPQNHAYVEMHFGQDPINPGNFVQLTPAEFTALTGKKLTWAGKVQLKVMQKQIKKDLQKNPDVLLKDYYDPVKQKFRLDSLWFVLGVLIGPLAVLFSFTSRRQKMSRKSAFLGFLVFVGWFGFLFLF